MRTIYQRKLFMLSLFILLISAGLYSCKCARCLTTPPPLNAYATQLEAANHSIDSALSDQWIHRYDTYRDSICTNMVQGNDSILNYAESFNKKYLLKVLCLPGSIGIRIYYGMDSLFKIHQIINGVNQKGKDLFFKYKLGDPPPLGNPSPLPGALLRLEAGMPCKDSSGCN